MKSVVTTEKFLFTNLSEEDFHPHLVLVYQF